MKKVILNITTILTLLMGIVSCDKNVKKSEVRITVNDAPPEVDTLPAEPDITNYKHFPSRNLKASPAPFTFTMNTASQNDYLNTVITTRGASVTVEDYLKNNATVAFLVIKDDKIVVEKYYPNQGNNYTINSVTTSFSVAKSVTSALLGIAIGEGKIRSVEEPITNYLPELKNGKGFERITIKHLLNMVSGIKFDESYILESDAGRLYTTPNILAQVKGLDIEQGPGQIWNYQSINTQLLGIIIARATNVSLTQYLQDNIWTPLGMEYDASWSLDRVGGIEKSFCCINARARDFAKFGRLYLNGGKWQGKQIVPASWIAASVMPDLTSTQNAFWYNYQWWFPKTSATDPTTDFYAAGFLGQYIYISPNKNLIIVRLSNDKRTDSENEAIMKKIVGIF
jgi:CubicO group peptidase (beta-lactamase class C family)